jgi:CelD/BcsL family acetyltransferase involved in cellulose biosynthesis
MNSVLLNSGVDCNSGDSGYAKSMMQLEVIRTLPQWLALCEEWNNLLVRSVVRVPFLRHEFLTAWWAHLGGCGEWPHGELYVVLARDNARLVAAAPLFASVDGEQDPVLALIGSDAMADYLDLLAESEYVAPFVDALLDHLTSADAPEARPWRSVDLFNLRDDSPVRAELCRAAAARGLTMQQTVLGICRVVPLEQDWDNYLSRRVAKKHRHEIRRKMRRAEEASETRWYFIEGLEAIPAATGDLLALMEQNPEKREQLTPQVRAQWHDILLAAQRGGFLRLAFLEIDGAKAAACAAFDFDGRIWVYNLGLDDRFRGFSPGTALLTYVFQWAISAGRTEGDFLRGEHDFKARLGAQRRTVYGIRLFRVPSDAPPEERPLSESIADDVLAAGLGAAAIVQRGELPAMSSDNCEIVTCQMPDESVKRFFCKFGPLNEPAGPAHRFGLGYEARVYDELLRPWADEVPPLHGAFLDEAAQLLVLALDYLEGGTLLHQVWQPKSDLGAAARWIARFHQRGETATVPAFLRRYDTAFYCTWLRRAAEFTRDLHPRYPWLPELCERGMRRLPALLAPATIVHGEYQANNILVYRARTVPTDWESAALAAGEIDLASLAWGWEDDIPSYCEEQYCLVRWPDGPPDDFALRLAAARVFLHLRWLGDSEPGEDTEAAITAIEELVSLAERFADLDR